MSLGASVRRLLIALTGLLVVPVLARAEPLEATLPMLEVPEGAKPDANRRIIPPKLIDRSNLLSKPMVASDPADRAMVERYDSAWKRVSGGICSGCGNARSVRKVIYIDPVAVLNASSATKSVAKPADSFIRVARVSRVHLAHRHSRSNRLYAYFRRLRYAALRWRKPYHHRHHKVGHARLRRTL